MQCRFCDFISGPPQKVREHCIGRKSQKVTLAKPQFYLILSPTNLLKSLKMSNSKDIDLPTCQDCHFSTCQTILELNILPTLKRHPKCPIQPNCQEAIKKIVDIFQHAKTFHQWEVYCKLCTFKSLQKLTPRIVRKHLDCFKCYKTFNSLKHTQMWENPQSE